MMKPQKKKYRVFARDFDRKPEIKEYDQLDEIIAYMKEEKWITLTLELKTSEKR